VTAFVSALSPTQYTELALVLFLGVFALVGFRHGRKRPEHDECARIPLEDEGGAS
jgi:hypothetical protein